MPPLSRKGLLYLFSTSALVLFFYSSSFRLGGDSSNDLGLNNGEVFYTDRGQPFEPPLAHHQGHPTEDFVSNPLEIHHVDKQHQDHTPLQYEEVIKSPSAGVADTAPDEQQKQLSQHQSLTEHDHQSQLSNNNPSAHQKDPAQVKSAEEAAAMVHDPAVWKNHNALALELLEGCFKGGCPDNRRKVVLLDNIYFKAELYGYIAGEFIWARSVRKAMDALGVTYIYVEGMNEASILYRKYPTLIKMVITSDQAQQMCHDSVTCMQTKTTPDGIPEHIMFTFHFFGGIDLHTLGPRWTLTAEPFFEEKGNTYLGYSIFEQCAAVEPVATEQRKNQVYLFTKFKSAFSGDETALPCSMIRSAKKLFNQPGSQHEGLEFVAAYFGEDAGCDAVTRIGNGGILSEKEFYNEIAFSKAVIGVGAPWLSPTPYISLCLSTPFLNPTLSTTPVFYSQHTPIGKIGSPYSYNYLARNQTSFNANLEKALEDHRASYVPPRMTRDELQRRVLEIIDFDWEKEAMHVRAQTKKP